MAGNKQEMPYLPLAFGAMHFGAGAGMLAGFWRILRSKLTQKRGERGQ
jgi:hypothetical protein